MLISLDWLKTLLPLDRGAGEVAAVLTARGLTVDAIAARGTDVVLDVDVPANRPDCLGHLGIARELAAAFGLDLAPRPGVPAGSGRPVADRVRVSVEAPELCARYTARVVSGVRIAPSPAWVVSRLEACGLRSINNVVDVSNLVLLELGQPIHTFDLERMEGAEIRVRRAAPGEAMRTLDGAVRRLDPGMLVIADARAPLAVAGVMGGAESEITDTTRDVLIEAAWFLPTSVRATARRLGLSTDSSQRFERGTDPGLVVVAQDAAVRWIVELAGGKPSPGIVDVHPCPRPIRELALRVARVAALLGYAPSEGEVIDALRSLGLDPTPDGTGTVRVRVPSWRVDLDREADLVEEVGRHLGYDRIPSRVVSGGAPPPESDRGEMAEELARDYLAQFGFLEAFNYAMIAPGEDDAFVPAREAPPLAIANPIAEGLAILRRSVLPGLVRSADSNLRRGARDVRLFESGRVFLRRAGAAFPQEPRRVGVVWCGAARPRHWGERTRDVDLYDVAGVAEGLLRHLGLEGDLPAHVPSLAALHPGRAVAWGAEGQLPVAWCGQVHPEIADRLGAAVPLFVAEIDLDRLAAVPRAVHRYRALPRVPSVSRDLSLTLPPGIRAAAVLATLREVPAPADAAFGLVDRYEGPPLPAGTVSLTVRVMLQPLDQTLTDAETEAYRGRLVEVLESLGIRLRA